jgi:1-acyl-sn-glycerol-3-phosphate acyltransferase
MIKAKHSKLYIGFYKYFFGTLQKIFFRKMSIVENDHVPANQSVLLLPNHFSWWDGYWVCWVSHYAFKRRFHVMMLEEQLSKRMFINRAGIFSIKPNSRESLESLNYAAEILRDPKNTVVIFPTGVLLSQHQKNMHFQKGINLIMKGKSEHFAVVLSVFLVDYFGFVRPEVRIYLKNYLGERTSEAIEKAYSDFYQECVTKQTE